MALIAAAGILLGLLAGAVGQPRTAHAQQAATFVHIVQAGESLGQIALQFGIDEEQLLKLNHLADPNAIYVGQRLLIPAGLIGADQPAPPGTHRVQPGETLSTIAADHGLTVDQLLALNNLPDPNALYEGQLLLVQVDSVGGSPATAAAVGPSARPPVASSGVYTVQVGETLSSVATRLGIPLNVLMRANGIADPNALYAGQVLTLPTPAAPTAAAASTPAAPQDSPIPATYVVQVGETLSGIAARYGLALDKLEAINGLDAGGAIYSGQVLRLTAAPAAEPTAAATISPSTVVSKIIPMASPSIVPPQAGSDNLPAAVHSDNPAASLNQVYTIRSGDTLRRIALRTGVDANALRLLNRFASLDDALVAGDTLLLPATGDELRPRSPAQQHVVQAGESLSAIADSYSLATVDLLSANRIADPNAIYPGQVLVIPPRTLDAGTSGPPPQIGPARSGYYYYTVKAGDTLSALAGQFNSTVLALRDFNNLPDNETVYAGLELRIPFGAPDLGRRVPPVPQSGTRFIVSLSRQQCWLFEGDRLAHAWNCSTGYGEWKTKTGDYAVQSKIPVAKSSAYRLDMPYWLGIYDVGKYENGIHGLPVLWDTGQKIWGGQIGEPATFGCAMLDDKDAAVLYRSAYLGMPIHITN